MNEQVLYAVLNLGVNVLELLVLLVPMAYLFHVHSTRKFKVLLYAILFVMTISIQSVFLYELFTRTVILFVLWSAWLVLMYRMRAPIAFYFVLLYVVLLWTTDTISLGAASVLFGISEITQFDPLGLYVLIYIIRTADLGFMMLACMLFKRFSTMVTLPVRDLLLAMVLPLLSLLMLPVLFDIVTKQPQFVGEASVMMMVAISISIASPLYVSYAQQKQADYLRADSLARELKIEKEHLYVLGESYRDQRKQIHDFNSRMFVLRGLAQRNANQAEFASYLDEVLDIDMPAPEANVNTGRPTVDVVVASRFALARAKGVSMTFQLDDLSTFPLGNDDLIVVLSNLLDNALAAAEKVEDPSSKYVQLKMKQGDHSAVLYVENSTSAPVAIADNQVVREPGAPLSHGFGLVNVCECLDKAGAKHAMEYDEGVFRFSAVIPVP
ncbi:MAG: GHKL domain-containing protein [Eggerthellaceae bacterium]|nr:GHKL domain-containing protein [Eggerthellaceae bacterium]MBQ9067543.1 GHKL domain-containing protein [Eggerthellaceae bacterium]